METPPPPEFGPNGAVLNSATMTEALKQDYLGKAPRRRAEWPRRFDWGWRALVMFPLVTVWFTSDPAGHGPLWFKLAATGAAAAFLARSFWTFSKRSYLLWGMPYGLALLGNWIVYYFLSNGQ